MPARGARNDGPARSAGLRLVGWKMRRPAVSAAGRFEQADGVGHKAGAGCPGYPAVCLPVRLRVRWRAVARRNAGANSRHRMEPCRALNASTNWRVSSRQRCRESLSSGRLFPYFSPITSAPAVTAPQTSPEERPPPRPHASLQPSSRLRPYLQQKVVNTAWAQLIRRGTAPLPTRLLKPCFLRRKRRNSPGCCSGGSAPDSLLLLFRSSLAELLTFAQKQFATREQTVRPEILIPYKDIGIGARRQFALGRMQRKRPRRVARDREQSDFRGRPSCRTRSRNSAARVCRSEATRPSTLP